MNYNKLIFEAISSLDYSHKLIPSNLRFGAAVLTDTGNIYKACAFWSYTSTLTLHAEQAAIAHAAAHGEKNIVAVACVSTEDEKGEKYCHPCGICKQLIYESSMDSGIDIDVVMASLKGEYVVKKISELVPHPWPAV
jgi:cytidine deaminase